MSSHEPTDEEPQGDTNVEPLSTAEEFDVPPEVAAEIEQAGGGQQKKGFLGFLSWLR